MPTVELARFRVDPAREQDLLRARPDMLADFRADRAGFIDAHLVQLPGDEQLDVVLWEKPEEYAASRAKSANRPGTAGFFYAIAELISFKRGSTR